MILDALHEQGLVTGEAMRLGHLLNRYGMLIENTDRHAGNLALVPDSDGRLSLSPAYDQLPMRYVLYAGDIAHPRPLQVPVADGDIEVGVQAMQLAHRFWLKIEADPHVSIAFRTLAENRARTLEAALEETGDTPAPG